MWEHQCQHTNRDGSMCKREATEAVWCFEWEGLIFPSATWIEACPWHQFNSEAIITVMETKR